MYESVVQKLIQKGYRIAFAESCTGGMVCAALVSVADASKVLDVSFVTYANEAKMQYLGVREAMIEEHGVVSEQVAREMAIGVARQAGSQVGVGITGVAGPSGGTEDKPVGMVCFAFYVDGDISAYTMQFGDVGRNEVRAKSVEFVYETLDAKLNC